MGGRLQPFRAALIARIQNPGRLPGVSPQPAPTLPDLILAHPAVAGINGLKIIHLSPSDIFVAVSLEFRDEQTLSSVEDAVRVMEGQTKRTYPAIRQLFLEMQAKDDHLFDLRQNTDSPGEG